MSMTNFDILPNELLCHIFSFLPYKDLENVAPVCSAWCDVSNLSKEKILKVVANVLKNGYNELVDKHHREGFYDMAGAPPMKKAEKIVIKNLRSGVCKILTKDYDNSMYYQIPSELLQKLLFTTNIKSVNSLRKLPEDGEWIRKYKCHKKFFFPCKTFVDVFSSIYSKKFRLVDEFSMIDISDFEKGYKFPSISKIIRIRAEEYLVGKFLTIGRKEIYKFSLPISLITLVGYICARTLTFPTITFTRFEIACMKYTDAWVDAKIYKLP